MRNPREAAKRAELRERLKNSASRWKETREAAAATAKRMHAEPTYNNNHINTVAGRAASREKARNTFVDPEDFLDTLATEQERTRMRGILQQAQKIEDQHGVEFGLSPRGELIVVRGNKGAVEDAMNAAMSGIRSAHGKRATAPSSRRRPPSQRAFEAGQQERKSDQLEGMTQMAHVGEALGSYHRVQLVIENPTPAALKAIPKAERMRNWGLYLQAAMKAAESDLSVIPMILEDWSGTELEKANFIGNIAKKNPGAIRYIPRKWIEENKDRYRTGIQALIKINPAVLQHIEFGDLEESQLMQALGDAVAANPNYLSYYPAKLLRDPGHRKHFQRLYTSHVAKTPGGLRVLHMNAQYFDTYTAPGGKKGPAAVATIILQNYPRVFEHSLETRHHKSTIDWLRKTIPTEFDAAALREIKREPRLVRNIEDASMLKTLYDGVTDPKAKATLVMNMPRAYVNAKKKIIIAAIKAGDIDTSALRLFPEMMNDPNNRIANLQDNGAAGFNALSHYQQRNAFNIYLARLGGGELNDESLPQDFKFKSADQMAALLQPWDLQPTFDQVLRNLRYNDEQYTVKTVDTLQALIAHKDVPEKTKKAISKFFEDYKELTIWKQEQFIKKQEQQIKDSFTRIKIMNRRIENLERFAFRVQEMAVAKTPAQKAAVRKRWCEEDKKLRASAKEREANDKYHQGIIDAMETAAHYLKIANELREAIREEKQKIDQAKENLKPFLPPPAAPATPAPPTV